MPDNRALYHEFISFMVECGALLFGDFTLKSGRKSPYFINTGEYKTGAQLSRLGDFYSRLIQNSVLPEPKKVDEKIDAVTQAKVNDAILSKFGVLFGPAYKGIPIVTAAAAKLSHSGLELNVSFNRKEQKDHGEGALIMGYYPQAGDRIAIVEDVTTAGTSVREIVKLLEDLKIDAAVVALYISVDRMEKGIGDMTAISQLKSEFGIDVYSIATVEDVITYLMDTPDDCVRIPDGHMHAENIRKYLAEYGGMR